MYSLHTTPVHTHMGLQKRGGGGGGGALNLKSLVVLFVKVSCCFLHSFSKLIQGMGKLNMVDVRRQKIP